MVLQKGMFHRDFYFSPELLLRKLGDILSALLIFTIKSIKLTAVRLTLYLEWSRDVQQYVLRPQRKIEAASKPCN